MTEGVTSAQVKLPAVLDLTAASPLAAELSALRGRPVCVDASAVERLGTLCLQVLLSALATWAADDKPFMLDKTSGPFQDALALAGAGHLITNRQGVPA
jgi:chemotaxis protein CheX